MDREQGQACQRDNGCLVERGGTCTAWRETDPDKGRMKIPPSFVGALGKMCIHADLGADLCVWMDMLGWTVQLARMVKLQMMAVRDLHYSVMKDVTLMM